MHEFDVQSQRKIRKFFEDMESFSYRQPFVAKITETPQTYLSSWRHHGILPKSEWVKLPRIFYNGYGVLRAGMFGMMCSIWRGPAETASIYDERILPVFDHLRRESRRGGEIWAPDFDKFLVIKKSKYSSERYEVLMHNYKAIKGIYEETGIYVPVTRMALKWAASATDGAA